MLYAIALASAAMEQPSIVEAAEAGFQTCLVFNATKFANHNETARDAVKMSLVSCRDDLNRMRTIFLDYVAKNYPNRPSYEEVNRLFNRYISQMCADTELALIKNGAK